MGARPPLPYRFANPYIKEHSEFVIFMNRKMINTDLFVQ